MDDLELAVLLLNSVDLLEEPADRMADDLRWWRRALRHHGHEALARTQREADLPALQALRTTLRAVFEAPTDGAARRLLNEALRDAGAVVQVAPDGLAVTGGLPGRLLYAVAAHVAAHGVARLGLCASDPCRCAYVDRTRAGTRRYCCTLCNDRAAARAYRARRSGSTTD